MKLALFIFLTGCFCTQIQAQNYINETARWEQFTSYYQSFENNYNCYITYFISGDTVANGTTYYRLMRTSDCTYISPNLDSLGNSYIDTSTSNLTVFNRYIREAEQTIYVYDAATNIESWVYRFNLIEPISIDFAVNTAYTPSGCGSIPELLAHDTVCIGSIARKRWSLTQGVSAVQSFIEGVGPGSGLFGPICNTFSPDLGAGLVRFMLNGDTLYSGSCSTSASLHDLDQRGIDVEIQAGSLKINSVSALDVSVFSLDGCLVFRSNYQGPTLIHLNQLTPGIYVYHLKGKDAIKSGKFVLSN
jgi:hypothetical protein